MIHTAHYLTARIRDLTTRMRQTEATDTGWAERERLKARELDLSRKRDLLIAALSDDELTNIDCPLARAELRRRLKMENE